MPVYEKRLVEMRGAFTSWLGSLGLEIPSQVLTEYFDPGKAMKMAASTLSGLSGLLTNVFLIMLTVIFILLEASGLPQKLRKALGDPQESLGQFRNFTESVNRYLALKTLFSLATGVTIAIWLAVLGVDFPLLWGLVAFLLNYVPNIGSIIAAIPLDMWSLTSSTAVSSSLSSWDAGWACPHWSCSSLWSSGDGFWDLWAWSSQCPSP